MTDTTIVPAEITEAVRADVEDALTGTVTISDLIRAGAAHTVKHEGWGGGDRACALSAAGVAADALGII